MTAATRLTAGIVAGLAWRHAGEYASGVAAVNVAGLVEGLDA